MKYAAVLLLASGAYATTTLATATVDDASAGVTAKPAEPSLNSLAVCVSRCDGDLKCRASCGFVPAPNSAQAEGNVNCVSSSCVPLQTDVPAYSKCLDECRNEWFYNPGNAGGVPGDADARPTGSAGSGDSDSEGSDSDGSGSGGSGSDSDAAGTESDSTASPSATGSSAGSKLTFSVAGVLGAVGLIAFAL